MHKSICNEYGPLPMLFGLVAVPYAATEAQNLLYHTMDKNELLWNTAWGALMGTGFAIAIEIGVVEKSNNEQRGRTWTSKMVQKGQLAGYFTGLVGALAINAAIEYTDIENFDVEDYEQSRNSQQINEIPVYSEP